RFRDSLDDRKSEELTRTVHQVNKWFGGIFRSLLPNVNAKLSPPQGMTQLEGLELKVQLGSVWKESLSELSGGQKSLLALSLVLALLKFNPAPMYILDEVDAALDVSHTTNIGRMIKEYFPQAQFIIVSLKDGMFNNANVLFRTRFVDGTSAVSRTELRGSSVAASRSPGVAAGSQNARGRKRRAADALQEAEN
ncbi:Structural maintenance of chromosomes protein 2, partial [Perkinsus olseni]